MITNKDIRVENGYLIINGNKYPLDGQSPEAIMAIVEDNSDSTPTEDSTAPITSGGVFAADKDITDTIGDITQTGVAGATVAAQIKELNTMSRSVTGNIAITRTGALRVITFNRVAYTNAQAFFTALAAEDKPTNVQFNTVMRTSNDNKYMTLGFVYVDSTGLTVKHFAGYNADGVEGQIGSTDLIIGEIVYTV